VYADGVGQIGYLNHEDAEDYQYVFDAPTHRARSWERTPPC
jgi:hypothetical protein